MSISYSNAKENIISNCEGMVKIYNGSDLLPIETVIIYSSFCPQYIYIYIHGTFAMQIKSRRGDIHVKVHGDVHRFPNRSILDAFPARCIASRDLLKRGGKNYWPIFSRLHKQFYRLTFRNVSLPLPLFSNFCLGWEEKGI